MNVGNEPRTSFTSTNFPTLQRNAPIPGSSATLGREDDGSALDFKFGSLESSTPENCYLFATALDKSSWGDNSVLSVNRDPVVFGVSKDPIAFQRNPLMPSYSANLAGEDTCKDHDWFAATPVRSSSQDVPMI